MKFFKRLSIVAVLLMIMSFLIPITAFAADIFSTTGQVATEKDIYYVGDTVEITDYFRNKGANNATNVSVEYYYRLDGANSVYSGTSINFGTIASGTSESHSFEYTFKETDIGEYRIGAKITYMEAGAGPFQEYSSGHNFIVMQAPTPTPTSTPTATETPAPTSTPTAAPTNTPTSAVTPEPIETLVLISPEVAVSDGADTQSEANGLLFGDNTWLFIIIAALGVLLIILIVIIIVVAAKRNKKNFR